MKRPINGGAWPTIITLFQADGGLDLEANRMAARRLVEMGSGGIFGVCQSSEMFFLTLKEKLALAEIVLSETDGKASCVISGHTADDPAQQLRELKELAQVGADAMVLVTNRLAGLDDGMDVFTANTSRILDALPDVEFGFYECPYPFKRLLSDEELAWCAETGRIRFLKDVSCDAAVQRQRAEIVRNSPLRLYNANTQTLLESLRLGYAGYNGVMGNFHIDLYDWLCGHINDPRAEQVQQWLSSQAEIETPAYPVVAKYYLQRKRFDVTTVTRSKDEALLTQAERERVERLEEGEARMRAWLGLAGGPDGWRYNMDPGAARREAVVC